MTTATEHTTTEAGHDVVLEVDAGDVSDLAHALTIAALVFDSRTASFALCERLLVELGHRPPRGTDDGPRVRRRSP